MNKIRRKKIAKAVDVLRQVYNTIDVILSEEQDSFDNTPEALQDSFKGEKMQETIGHLEDCMENIEDAIESLEMASA